MSSAPGAKKQQREQVRVRVRVGVRVRVSPNPNPNPNANPNPNRNPNPNQVERSARQLEAAREGADYDAEAGDELGGTLPDRLRARDRQRGVALVEAVRHFQSAEQKHAAEAEAEAEAEEEGEGEGEGEGGEGGGGRRKVSLRELKERELDEARAGGEPSKSAPGRTLRRGTAQGMATVGGAGEEQEVGMARKAIHELDSNDREVRRVGC